MSFLKFITKIMSFNYRGIDIGLTYPDALNSSKECVYNYLRTWNKNGTHVTKIMLAEEVGEKEKKRHYHVYLRFNKQTRILESDFDLLELATEHVMHPHIQKVKKCNNNKNITPMLKYLTKEDKNPLCNFDWEEMISKEEDKTNNSPPWREYLENDLTQDQVYSKLINDGYEKDLFNHYNNWSAAIKKFFKEEKRIEYQPNPEYSWRLPPELLLWKEIYLEGWDGKSRPRSLVLIGQSRTGKTEWARSLKTNHMYFNNLLNLDDWNEAADLIILDDFNSEFTKYLPSWKCFFGGQKQFTLTDKYRGKRTVHWGKPMIWLTNEDFRKHLNNEQLDFIDKNCFVYILDRKLY